LPAPLSAPDEAGNATFLARMAMFLPVKPIAQVQGYKRPERIPKILSAGAA
jgi:hypothetical protein